VRQRRIRSDLNAEDQVAILCRTAGATVQQVREDEHGWDLLVEFPPRIGTAFPDTEPSVVRCLVQVKSTQTRRTSTRVKVSNALKFAKDTLPCFIVLLTYPNSRAKFEAAYVKHFWVTEMAQALESARRASSEGQELHKHHLPVVFSESERLDDGLVGAMIEMIDRVGQDYQTKKKAFADSLGYEHGWGEANLVMEEGHGQGDLQDLLLGIRNELPLQSFTFTDKRFGISGQPQDKGSGRMSVDVKPSKKCAVTLRRMDDGEEISWPGALFSAGMTWLAIAEQKVRVSAGPLELIISGSGKATANWSAPLDVQRSLDELERDATLRSWMDGSALELTLWAEAGILDPFEIRFHSQSETNWSEVLYAIRALAKVVPPERRPDDFKVSMAQFLKRKADHVLFANSISAGGHAVKIEGDDIWDPALDAASHIVLPWPSRVGDYFLVSVVERDITDLTRDGSVIYLSTCNGRLLRGTLIKASDATNALVEGEVRWARDRAKRSDKRIISYHPGGDGFGTIELTGPDDKEDPENQLTET
jgi:hypothetical protein